MTNCLQADEGHRHAVADEVVVEGVGHVVCKPGKRGRNGQGAQQQLGMARPAAVAGSKFQRLALCSLCRLQLPALVLARVLVSLLRHHRCPAYSPTRLSMGPLPVAAYWAAKPRKPIMARRPLRISFHLYLSVCVAEGGHRDSWVTGTQGSLCPGAAATLARGGQDPPPLCPHPPRGSAHAHLLGGAAAQAHGVKVAAAHVGAAHGAAHGATHALEVLQEVRGQACKGVKTRFLVPVRCMHVGPAPRPGGSCASPA